MPQLNESNQCSLEKELSVNELIETIKSFSISKSPGPDGFGAEFYQAFHEILTPVLLRMINDSIAKKALPPSLYEANVCLLLKKGKDPTDPANYRPISLLNVDHKISTKAMAIRLNKYITTIIHPDQTGFIPGRLSFFNVRRLLNVLYSNSGASTQAAVMTLDAQKAFDSIEWPYLFEALRRFVFGETFVDWIKMTYRSPKSSIITNNIASTLFNLQRGVRQGDCLSPLLFNIALEPLAIGIRNHPHIKGIPAGSSECLVTLYADDLLLTLRNPEVGIPHLFKYIDSFSKISGYKINWSKSELMFAGENRVIQNCPVQVQDYIMYLGIKISKKPKFLFELNLVEGMIKLKSSIEYWRTLPISMIGRVNAIKMVSLPKFLYLFQNLLILISADFFKKLESIILEFIWGYKKHRLSKKHLFRSTFEGGLGLPVFKDYCSGFNQ